MASKSNSVSLNTQLVLDDFITQQTLPTQTPTETQNEPQQHTLTEEELKQNKEQAEKMKKYKKFTDKDIENILQSANNSNMVIDSFKSDGTVILKGKKPDGEYDIDCKLQFRDMSTAKNSNYTLEEVLKTIDDTPSLFKENLNKVVLSGRTGSNQYDGTQNGPGVVVIKKDWFKNEKDDDWNMKSSILHELAHNFDHNGQYTSKPSLTDSESFRKLVYSYPEAVTTYAGTYAHRKSDGSIRPGYGEGSSAYAEPFAELMSVVGMHRLYPSDNFKVRVGNNPTYISSGYGEYYGNHVKQMTYKEWEKTFPEPAKLGNALWDCKTREEAVELMDKISNII